jgi:hypothetical protein
MVSRDQTDVVLEVNASDAPVQVEPPTGAGCEIVQATDAEMAELQAYGFTLPDRRKEFGPKKLGDDPVARMLLPVGRSWWAISAGYAGLFAMVLFPAPIAIVLGGIAIWHVKNNPEKRGMPRAVFGLVMGVLGTAALIAVLSGP